MLLINSLMSQECIHIHPEVDNKESLIKIMLDSLKSADIIDDTKELFKAIMEREDLSSTALDFECAIPHAHCSTVKKTAIAVAVLNEGVDFNSSDGKLSKLIFLIVGPKNKAGTHLKILSKLARILYNEELRKHLMGVTIEVEFLDLIKKQEST